MTTPSARARRPRSGTTADQCRELGIAIGDTIEGREESGSQWHEARLTLLWLGESVAVFRVTERSSERPRDWSEPKESGDWTLEYRNWRHRAKPKRRVKP